jgi:hypothetical protein
MGFVSRDHFLVRISLIAMVRDYVRGATDLSVMLKDLHQCDTASKVVLEGRLMI